MYDRSSLVLAALWLLIGAEVVRGQGTFAVDNIPTVTICSSVKLSWSTSAVPLNALVIEAPGKPASEDPLRVFGIDGNTYYWQPQPSDSLGQYSLRVVDSKSKVGRSNSFQLVANPRLPADATDCTFPTPSTSSSPPPPSTSSRNGGGGNNNPSSTTSRVGSASPSSRTSYQAPPPTSNNPSPATSAPPSNGGGGNSGGGSNSGGGNNSGGGDNSEGGNNSGGGDNSPSNNQNSGGGIPPVVEKSSTAASSATTSSFASSTYTTLVPNSISSTSTAAISVYTPTYPSPNDPAFAGNVNVSVSVDDPRIIYNGAGWTDPNVFAEVGSSCNASVPSKRDNVASDSLIFVFNGTAIYMSTASTPKTGSYIVSLDGQPSVAIDGYTSSTQPMCGVTWSAFDLEDTTHTLVVNLTGQSRQATLAAVANASSFELAGFTISQMSQTTSRKGSSGSRIGASSSSCFAALAAAIFIAWAMLE